MAGYFFLLLSAAGSFLLLWAALLARRFHPSQEVPDRASSSPGITLLKPLHGDEPRLEENLESFLRQAYEGPVQVIFGIQDPRDPAAEVVERLKRRYPDSDLTLVCDTTARGANRKISNLANMMARVSHGVVVLSDSDMSVGRDYLARLAAALDAPGVGGVTCLYYGRGDAGPASRLVAMGISQHFLPSALVGLKMRLAHPCMGSTIALRRETLAAIGGFEAFSDTLADDHAIGEAVRRLGLEIVIPDMLLRHGCAERSLAELWRQEQRWSATVYGIDPAGYTGGIVLHPLPLALAGAALLGFSGPGLAGIALALCARGAAAVQVSRASGERPELPLVPVRDLLSFAVFFSAFFARSVDWRGARLRIASQGRLSKKED